jgi:hypothetical protein
MRRVGVTAMSTALAFVLAWLCGEAFFRLRYPPSYIADPSLTPHAALGWDSIPDIAPLPLNRGSLPSVVFVGDSFTQGRAWPSEAQRLLRERGMAIDGFNLGVSGYGTTQEWLKLKQHLGALAPRAIVVLFFAWNDLRDNYPYPELYYGPQRTTRPYLLIHNGHISVSPVRWAASFESRLHQSEFYLRVLNRGRLRVNAAIMGHWPDAPTGLRWRGKVYYEEPAGWQPFYRATQASSAYVRGAYDTTIEAFRQIRALAGHSQAALLVIGIDNSFTVDDDDARTFVEPNPDLDPSLTLTRMAALLGSEHIAFINAQPELRALRRELGRDVYNGPPGGLAGHLGEEGDRLIGAIAARWLASRVPSGSASGQLGHARD